MVAPELRARLTASRAVLGDFRAEVARSPLSRPLSGSWADRLAAELDSVCNGLAGALSMLGDASEASAAQEHQAALRDLVAAIAEITAPPYPALDPDPEVTRRHIEEFRDLQRDRAHQVASAARHVTEYAPAPDVIHAFARGLRAARQPDYPVTPEPETEAGQ